MGCNTCKTKPVIELINKDTKLCKKCFIRYFEKKVKKTIRNYNLIKSGDHIGVGVSGGKDSLTTLYLINEITKNNPKIKLSAILINEGIDNYREKTIKTAQEFCNKLNINLNIYSYKEEFGKKLDEVIKGKHACSVCGVLRRNLLNKYARENKVTKLATGHNMDDETQSILMNQFKNNIRVSARLGPITGIRDNPKFVRRIKPLYFVTEKEVATYAFLKGFLDKFTECPNNSDSFRNKVRDLINEFENKFPGTKHNIINSFIETLPLLKKEYSKNSHEIIECKTCGEPCSQNICRACQTIEIKFQ